MWEALGVLAPVELAAVYDNATNGGAVASYPFCSGVYDDVGAVIDRAAEVTTCAEGIVDLSIYVLAIPITLKRLIYPMKPRLGLVYSQ